ncbi:putative receptor-like protein kinase At1g80870 [Phragmites australis]|uniref:putative receptor-like protein kinase At1g80870 n=1 Tax=Phragmites australis TaxID=29695 RepID=UPI002D778554|nr:putative receptor-like protein kinase At1g80870 [Phragmites australis]
MPSRLLQQTFPPPAPPPPPPPLPANNQHHRQALLAATVASAAAAIALLFLLVLLLLLRRRRRRHPTLPFSPPPAPARPLRRYSRRALRRATGGFHPSRLLGRGAASPVYLATFPDASLAAVKTCASPHELHLLALLPDSPRLVSLLGYSSGSGVAGAEHPLLLVFEYVPNGSLQGALFGGDAAGRDGRFLDWPKRLAVIRDVARALAFLHAECHPPVVHGDLKPSNVLLNADFRAKLADFGLARLKTPDAVATSGAAGDDFMSQELGEAGDHLSTTTSAAGGAKTDVKDESGPARAWGKEWWWKQDGSGELDSRDYVAEWIGSQICPERNPDWADENDGNTNDQKTSPSGMDERAVSDSPEDKKNANCNSNADGAAFGHAGEKKEATKMREWWKEEFFEEMSKKGGSFDKRRGSGKPWLRSISMNTGHGNANANGDSNVEPSGLDLSFRRSRKRNRGRGRSVGSDIQSGDFLSRDLSSTTSMRGTVCYVAPECGGGPCEHGTDLLEKADVYSFGVLVLVILSGRRPLHILSSPMKLEKANLVSWCRQLARAGNVLELMDERLDGGYDKDQATLCVQLALLCLQRQPEHRPDSTDIVKILDGEMELPPAPVEFSPSPRVRPFPRSSRRAPQPDAAE